MKLRGCIFLMVCMAGLASVSHASDRTGVLGLNYTVGPSFIVGGEHATDVSSVEPGVGAGLQMGISRNIDVKMDYDYIDADLRTQALTFGGQFKFAPDSVWSPFAGAGLGFGKPRSTIGWGHVSLKLYGGLEKELTSNVSIIPVISYQYVEGPDPFGSVHVIEPGIRLVYYFGGFHR